MVQRSASAIRPMGSRKNRVSYIDLASNAVTRALKDEEKKKRIISDNKKKERVRKQDEVKDKSSEELADIVWKSIYGDNA